MKHTTPSLPTRVSRITAGYQAQGLRDIQASLVDGPFGPHAVAPCQVPVHDMGCLDRYHRQLPVREAGEIVSWVPAEPNISKYEEQRNLRPGDTVQLVEHAIVSGYWFEESVMVRGSWDNHIVLAGSLGTVVTADTPWVLAPRETERVFANVDIPMPDGTVSRVRVAHTALRRVTPVNQLPS